MPSSLSESLPRALAPDLELTQAHSLADLQAVLDGHLDGFGEDDREPLSAKFFRRPGAIPEHVLYVRDTTTGQSVSSVSLVPQTWTYEGIPFRVGEVGVVSTRKAYRKRGLVRYLFEAYHTLAAEENCLISVIAGIPYFYRQFGYDYILPLDGRAELRAEQVPDLKEGEISPYRIRLANEGDMPILLRFYDASNKGVCVSSQMTAEIWRYQDASPDANPDRRATYIVEREGAPVGFFRMNANELSDWARGARIKDAYLPDREMCLAALRFAKRIAIEERQQHTITVEISVNTPILQTVYDLGAEPRRSYAWQIKVLDPAGFLRAIGPALERRLVGSPWEGLTQTITIKLYTQFVALRFEAGRLVEVTNPPDAKNCELNLPPNAAAMLWLGYRSIEELMGWYPDAGAKDKTAQRLAGVLFPKKESWVRSLF